VSGTGLGYVDRKIMAIYLLMDSVRAEAEGYMKSTAPWKDRTGMARQNLKATIEYDKNKIRLILSHGVPYGYYLEYSRGGKYAILNPTKEIYVERIKKLIKELFREK